MPRAPRVGRKTSVKAVATSRPIATENQDHVALAKHLDARLKKGVTWWHTPNGEKRDKATAAKLKRMGVRRGVPDFFFAADRLYALELKRLKGGKLSDEQEDMIDALHKAGVIVIVANGLDEALAILENLELIKPDRSRRPARRGS